LRKIWGNRPYIAAGGFDRASANNTVEKHGGLIAFGRHFIANVSTLFLIENAGYGSKKVHAKIFLCA
jgi:2,4-dienoyl-CoA reductase-like NADH-dependent reductase (Old Yellow Enzyme family)